MGCGRSPLITKAKVNLGRQRRKLRHTRELKTERPVLMQIAVALPLSKSVGEFKSLGRQQLRRNGETRRAMVQGRVI